MKKKTHLTVKIEGSLQDVWQRLATEAGVTSWLGERARVDLQSGGAYEVTSGTPLVSGRHQVLEVESGKRLLLEWCHQDFPTLVTFELKQARGTTLVKVTHEVEGTAPYPVDDCFGGDCGNLREMWCYNLGLLKTAVELGEAQCRLPSSRKPDHAVTHVLALKARPEEVFDALVNPEKIKGWNNFAPDPRVEKKPGGRYSFGWKSEESGKDGPGEVVEYQEGRKITYTWHGDPKTLVSWEVEPIGDESGHNTRLKLVHSGFIKDQNMLVEWNLGWAAFLHCFVIYLDKGRRADWCDVTFDV